MRGLDILSKVLIPRCLGKPNTRRATSIFPWKWYISLKEGTLQPPTKKFTYRNIRILLIGRFD